MPINPFRAPANYDVPNFPAPAGRYDPSVFSNIAGIGDAIGAYRDQQQMAELSKGAIGPDGQVDINKLVTAHLLAGRPATGLLREIETMRHQRAQEGTAKTLAEAAMLSAKRRQWTYDPGDVNAGMPPGWRSSPGEDGTSQFVPDANAPASIVPRTKPPGPQTSLTTPGNMAAASFDPNDPENAPPYQVAGPDQPVPRQPPQNQPVVQAQPKAAQPASNLPPDFDQRIAPLPAGRQEQLRSVGNYETDPYKIEFPSKNGQANFFSMMRDLVPGWSPDEYGRREEARKKAEALAETGPKAEQTKLGTERATIQAEAVKDAKAAADLQPILNDITRTWENLTNFKRFGKIETATGPYAASTPSRLAQTYLPGGATTEEQLRQAYERSLAALKAHATKVMNQGQGAVSNYERQMFAQVFPELTSSNPSGELATLKQMQKRGEQVMEIGRGTELGKSTPGFLGERPAIERPGGDRYGIDAQTAKQYREAPEIALNRAREFIKNGADPDVVKGILRKIDPSLPGKL